jgi:small subunit ribosomal protein S20
MANTKSAQKATRVIERRTAVNKARRTRMRSSWRSVQEAIAAGDSKAAEKALREAESETMRAVSKGVAHKNTGSRKVSRLAKRVGALSKAKR